MVEPWPAARAENEDPNAGRQARPDGKQDAAAAAQPSPTHPPRVRVSPSASSPVPPAPPSFSPGGTAVWSYDCFTPPGPLAGTTVGPSPASVQSGTPTGSLREQLMAGVQVRPRPWSLAAGGWRGRRGAWGVCGGLGWGGGS